MHELQTVMRDYLAGGGIIMIPLVLVSIALWWIAARKFLELSALKAEEVSLETCLEEKGGSKWQCAIMQGYQEGRCGDTKLDRKLLSRLRQQEARKAGRHIATVFVLASLAPLLGLLGTVTGMIDTFDAITQYGTGNARAMASGISAALITTQTGLIVAVPGLLAANMLRRRAERLRGRIQRFCLELSRLYTDGRRHAA